MKITNIILAIVFIAFAVLQYNDPDPYIWLFVYGVTALLCINSALGKTFRLANILLIVFSVVWMVLLVPQLVEWIVGGMPASSNASDRAVVQLELVREFFGLLMVILTMLLQLRNAKSAEISFNNN